MATLKQINECNKAATEVILGMIRSEVPSMFKNTAEYLLNTHVKDVHDIVDVVISTYEKEAEK